jgi:xanthine dehydrogenase accessory factor
MTVDQLTRADGLRAARTPFVLATVVRAERPTSARPGDRAIVLADGTIEGFVGGACAAATLRAQSAALLQAGTGRPPEGATSVLLRITPGPGPDPDAGPTPPGLVVVDNPCLSGGTLEIFLEAVVPPPLVHVFGESPIARALVEVATAAGYQARATADPADPVPADATGVVVASHGHDEEPVLRAGLAAGVPYLALVASPKRGAAALAELGLSAAEAARVSTPAGMDIGARTPGEVAVSILAELVYTRGATPPAGPPESQEPAAPAQSGTPSASSAPTGPPETPESQEPAAPAQSGTPSASSAPTEVDPVCGMSVAAVPASLSLEHAGRTWYFCAAGCRRAFVADPARYGA